MMGEFTCLVGLNRARIFLEFGWPQWGKSMSERAEKAEALAARIKPILAGNDPDIKGKRRRSFLPAPQRLSPCQRGQCPAGGGLKASAGRLKVALDAAPARTLSSERCDFLASAGSLAHQTRSPQRTHCYGCRPVVRISALKSCACSSRAVNPTR
jgi:hypothetical protein